VDEDGIAGEVVEHYQLDYDESERITHGYRQLELLRTREIVTRHLPAGPLRVLDVGGGTGAHAQWLAQDGHQVHLVDLVPRHVQAARALTERGLNVKAELGDARQLDLPDATFDAALLLGPLYHLTERADRVRALREVGRVVKPGGAVFAAAISRFASLFDGLARGFLFDPAFRPIVERDLAEGQHRNPDRRPHWFTTAYFHHPDELLQEAAEARLRVVSLVGVEGLCGWLPHLAERWDDPEARRVILESARAVEDEHCLRGLSAHLLLVAHRPA
jgi:SAM-dependent methyltransferase